MLTNLFHVSIKSRQVFVKFHLLLWYMYILICSMKNKISFLIGIIAILAFTACGKKGQKNEPKDSIKKDSVKKEQPKKEKTPADKLGINVPEGSNVYYYYRKDKEGYQLLAVELDGQTYKRKAAYFKDITDKDLQPCDIISDKNQGDNDILVIKTKGTQKEIKAIIPFMGDITINGKKLVLASFFVEKDGNRILTSSGGPVYMPFLFGENISNLEEINCQPPLSKNVKRDDGEYMVFPGKHKGKKVEILTHREASKFDKLILKEEGKEDIVFVNINP